jgi:hypothetical protein
VEISRETLRDLIHGSGQDEEWKVLDQVILDHWRWGTVSQIALENKGTGEKYGFTYRESSGEDGYTSLDDEPSTIEMYPIKTELVIRFIRADSQE